MANVVRRALRVRGCVQVLASSTNHARWRRTMPYVSRRSREERISTAVRLPVELHAELQRQAAQREVSVNYLITRAVYHYLRRLEAPDPLAPASEYEGVVT